MSQLPWRQACNTQKILCLLADLSIDTHGGNDNLTRELEKTAIFCASLPEGNQRQC